MEKQEKELGVSLTRKYKERDGPFFRSLEVALTSLHIQRQAYQGGTFVGNNVHKLLKPQSVAIVMSQIQSVAESRFSFLISDVAAVTSIFKELFIQYTLVV